MRKVLLSIVMTMVAVALLSSCLGEGTEYTYYDDVAITSFKLGTLNRYIHATKSDGSDSTYKRTLSCSDYSFYIDQATGEIWNNDSLPIDIDPSAVVCTISTKNGGTAYIKHLDSDTLDTYSSSDSIDFSTPRQIYVYNTNGSGYKAYTVHVNVHQEKGDSCIWSKITSGNTTIANLKAMKAMAANDNVYLFGNNGIASKVYATAQNDGVNWNEITSSTVLDMDAYKNIVLKDGKFFVLSNGQILSSADAINWTVVANTDIRQLVAASSFHLYALSAEGKLMSSSDEGATWVEEDLDDSASLLPYDNITYLTTSLPTNANAENILLYGSRSVADYADDATAVVWSKVVENTAGSRAHQWNYIEYTSENRFKAPRLTNMQIASYDDEIVAIGGKGIGTCTNEGLDRIFRSGDGGITWRNDSVMSIPEDLNSSKTVFGFTSDNQSVWIICGETGDVWKGRINRVAWKKEQDYFTE